VEQACAWPPKAPRSSTVGGESTRPGAEPVTADEELRRVIPVIERLRAATAAIICVDTSKAEVMRAASAAGAGLINRCARLARAGGTRRRRGERLRGVPHAHAG